MTKRSFLAMGFMLFGGALAAPLMAEQLVQMDTPVEMVVSSNPCTNQAIALSGKVHVLMNITTNGNSVHIQIHTNTQDVTGTGLVDGLKYNLVNGGTYNININGAQQMEMMMNCDYDLISQGSAPNQRVRMMVHFTIDANGNPTAEFVKGSSVCK